MDDYRIIKLIQEGDVDAYALLVRKYHRNLLAFIFRIVGDSDFAEDIGQEVFLNVYKELPRFDMERGTPFAAWLYIIARNQCVSGLRKQGRTVLMSDEQFQQLASAEESAETALIRQEQQEALAATLTDLPEPFRTTILMSLNGASLDEIAVKCCVPLATVKTRLFRAREKIKFLLKEHFGGVSHERKI
jgi:RNA polymerase sigma-70 factor (ECF subfamily)